MNFHLVAVMILSLISLCSCSTTAKVTGSTDLPNLSSSVVGVIIPLRFEASNSAQEFECSLMLRRGDEMKTYEIDFKPGQEILSAELPPGIYGYKEIYCGGGKHWNLAFKRWPRFQVFPNDLSFISELSVYLNESDNMSIRRGNREDNRLDALRLFGRLPQSQQSRVVSGYTGKAILADAIEKPARWKHWEIKDADMKDLKKTDDEDWPSFNACYDGEEDVNGLWLGNLQFTSVYENGDFLKTDNVDKWNTFSEHFIECINAVTKRFHPRNKARISYVLYI